MNDPKGKRHITVEALAAEMVCEFREKQANEWDKKSNDGTVRRALYMAWEQVELIERIKEMAANGQISPRGPLTNLPSGALSSVENDWYLSEHDAEAVRNWLRYLAEPLPTEKETEQALDEALITSVMRETVCNDRSIDWRYWVHQMPKLTAAQAARLFCALDPDIFENLNNRPNKNDPSDLAEKAKKIERLAEAQEMGSATPAEWLEWANSHRLKVHYGFRLEVQEILKAARGRYTLREAAQLIAQDTGEREDTMTQKLLEAVKMKQLPTFEPGRLVVIEYGNGPGKLRAIRDFYEECYWDDLNKWLSANEARVSFRFPAPQSQSEQADNKQQAAPIEAEEQATEGQTKSGLASITNGPIGITKQQALTAFGGLVTIKLSSAMEDAKQWIVPARTSKGTKGGRHESMWNPVLLAIALYEHKKVPKPKLNHAFFTHSFLSAWLDEWKEQSEELN